MGGTAITFGYWVRRRRLALDLTQAALARRVGCSAAAIKKIEHDERRPSRTMAARLAEALGLGPEQHERFVAAGLGSLSLDRLSAAMDAADVAAGVAPAWLSEPLGTDRARIVGRDAELARLHAHLEATVDGHGRVIFVTGEAGMGKTAILTGFAARSQRAVEDLVVARGAGTAAGGFGDPYLPVRDVFRMLVADPRAPSAADYLTAEQAKALWTGAGEAAAVIAESGPNLLDVVVPAVTVRQRLGSLPPEAHPGGQAIGGQLPGRLSGGTAGPASRDHVVTEVTDVLRELSARRPLVILLDDMQWADAASAELVFHLVRRLGNTRVLVVCAYRGSEVAGEHGPAADALRRALAETARSMDDPCVDLDRATHTAGRALCDALVALELPGMDASSREELYRRTRGNPLFVQELVRDLKARDDLVRSADGGWSVREGLDWDSVPARVAAVIERRLDRLGPDERMLLEAGAVEGEHFTAEIAARVVGVDERTAHYALARRLDQAHSLVRESGAFAADGRTLTSYRFEHALIRHTIYGAMSEGQRRGLHASVATELESVAGADTDDAARLAHHWTLAGDARRAVPYLIRAGDRARVVHAHGDALTGYRRAVEFLREIGDHERLARTMMKIGLTHQAAFAHDSAQAAFDEAFAMWAEVTRGAPRGGRSSATLRMVWREPETLDPAMGGFVLAAPMMTNLLSGLVRYDVGTNVVPDVARRWEISADGRRYTFSLRDDVEWTDGRPVTAHDFVYAYRRALDPASAVTGAAPALLDAVVGAAAVRAGEEPAEHAAIHAPDEWTLVIDLVEPTGYFIYNLAYYCLLPVPRHAVEEHGPTWWTDPATMVSNGPFRIAEWQHGRSMVIERNPNYHGPVAGNVGRVTLQLDVPDAEHEALYLTDDVDLLSSELATTPDTTIGRLRGRFPAEYSRREAFVTQMVIVDDSAPPLDDRRVRQAMAMAIDKDAVVVAMSNGMSTPATGGIVPPGMPGHQPEAALPYDPDRAAALVDEAAQGRSVPEITFLCRPGRERVTQALSEYWRAVGLSIRVEMVGHTSELFDRWSSMRGPKVMIGGWIADYPDPDTFLRVMVGETADSLGPGYRRLLARAATSTDSAARLEAYRSAEQILVESALLIPVSYEPSHLMLKPWVKEYPSVPVKYPGFWKDIVIGSP